MSEDVAWDELYPTVVALDPGGTSGWCVMSVHPEALCAENISVLNNITHNTAGEIRGDESRQEDELVALLDMWEHAAVLVEDYVLRHSRKDRESLSPVRLTAVVRYAARRLGRPIFTQSPSLAKTTVTDDRLKAWGLYVPGSDHARDATRHALTFFRRAKVSKSMQLSVWPALYGSADTKVGMK